MIISHQYRYLFIEVPNTGCTAIAATLRDQCAGEKILQKHATYAEFLKTATAAEKQYFVFGTVRNPLDVAVSYYYKLKTNHKGVYTSQKQRPWWSGAYTFRKHYDFIHETDADFKRYFFMFFRTVYNNYYLLLHERYRYVMRFESLAANFAEALTRIGVPYPVELPVINKTDKKGRFTEYYTPDMYAHAGRIFGPFMKRWGYSFPEDWGTVKVPWLSTARFASMDTLGTWGAKYLGIGPNSHGTGMGLLRKGIRRIWA